MRSGELRQEIVIQQPTLVKDGQGGHTETWSTYAITRAAVWPLSATQRVQHAQLENQITHRVRTRYITGVTANMRISYHDRILYIEGPPINVDEKNRMLDMLCREET